MDTSSQELLLTTAQETQLVPKWLPPHGAIAESRKKGRKRRAEVAYLDNKIPKSLNPLHLKFTRVLGDYLLFADGNEAHSFLQRAAPFHVTKQIASFEVDDVKCRLNLFNHPFSNLDMRSTIDELKKSSNKKIQNTLKAILDLESLAPQIPDFISKMKEYKVNGTWMDMFRNGEAPFHTSKEPKSVGMFVWEILHNDLRWDLRLVAATIPFGAVRAFGFSVTELTEAIRHEGVPLFLPKTCDHHNHIKHIFEFLKEVIQSPAEICKTAKRLTITTRDGTVLNVLGQEDWRMAKVGERAFLIVKRHGSKSLEEQISTLTSPPNCEECNEHQIVMKQNVHEDK